MIVAGFLRFHEWVNFTKPGIAEDVARQTFACFVAFEEGTCSVDMLFQKTKVGCETAYVIVDEAPFEYVRGKNGVLSMVSPEKAQAIRSKQRRHKLPKEPQIKAMLEKGLVMRTELLANPKLARAALAKRHGIEPSMLSRLIHLANAASEIQEYIRNMPPFMKRGLLSLRRLLPIIRNRDHKAQRQKFNKLLRNY